MIVGPVLQLCFVDGVKIWKEDAVAQLLQNLGVSRITLLIAPKFSLLYLLAW